MRADGAVGKGAVEQVVDRRVAKVAVGPFQLDGHVQHVVHLAIV